MKTRWLVFLLVSVMSSYAHKNMDKPVLFDAGWRFQQGDVAGAEFVL